MRATVAFRGLRAVGRRHASDWAQRLAQRRQTNGEPIVVRTVADMQACRQAMDVALGRPARVGFVPTMGALHRGHLSLLDAARAGTTAVLPLDGSARVQPLPPAAAAAAIPADFTVCSIFVNPAQFAPHEDLSTYPRTWATDYAALAGKGVDVVFAPTAAGEGGMYPLPPLYKARALAASASGASGAAAAAAAISGPLASPALGAVPCHRSYVESVGADAHSPEGQARPGFFRGVSTVVTKLLALVRPSHAVFGAKDGIQCVVVKSLARDLNLLPVGQPGCGIMIAPTARESDGLAMSSRNVYLTPPQRAVAPALYRALQHVHAQMAGTPAGAALLKQAADARAAALANLAALTSGGGAGGGGTGNEEEGIASRAVQAAGKAGAASAAVGAAAAASAGGGGASAAASAASGKKDALSVALEAARSMILTAHTGMGVPASDGFTSIDYLTLSDAATGAPIDSLDQSLASNGAVMLSVAARIGKTRLLDNIMITGSVHDLGEHFAGTGK